MGAPQVDLFAATSGTDSDWVVKLIDVYPNEKPEEASQGSKPRHVGLRAADRDRDFPRPLCRQLRQAAPAAARQGRALSLGLPNVNHVFLPGHRIMVQVQSSLFPLYDRNPQTFVPNIFYAKAGDYRKATQSHLPRRRGGELRCCCRCVPSAQGSACSRTPLAPMRLPSTS